MKGNTRDRQNGGKLIPAARAQTPAEFKTICLRECPVDNPLISDPEELAEFWRKHVTTAAWFNNCKECLCVFFLNARRQLTGFELVALGSLDSVQVHPRETFKTAIIRGAQAILVAHNHPSGDPSPSEGDIKATRDLIRAGQVLQIELMDHVIIGNAKFKGGFASLRKLGYFY